MKKRGLALSIVLIMFLSLFSVSPIKISAEETESIYKQRFMELYNDLKDPKNGYFSSEGIPYHAVEELIIEATDYGHLSTSEAFSYLMWLEAMNGYFTGDWSKFNDSWDLTEKYMIPSEENQPGFSNYNSSSPATYAEEYETPDQYPSELKFGHPVGKDPITDELRQVYGNLNYGMHWLLDVDNWYGFGGNNQNPVYINTFQRGPQESTWETVPHPSIEKFEYGGENGFLSLFTIDPNYARQWRYTIASDADARAVQATYWANKWAKEQGKSISSSVEKATKIGDFLRGSFFDKYFRKTGCQDPNSTGTGYDSCSYLLSWYYSWGGGIGANWSWKIGCSHNHSGYQNPFTAWVLSTQNDFKPKSSNGKSDWEKSLQRQLEFYTWLQSSTGAIAGGATNSLNGRYEQYPSNAPTFYGLVYKEAPVYLDPPDSRWFGMQTWTMQRIAELYYETKNQMAKELLDKWVAWVKTEVELNNDGTFAVPGNLKWTGQPDTWTGKRSANNGLKCEVVTKNQDIGVIGSLANTLTYYAKAAGDKESQNIAKELLDRTWTLYRDDIGIASTDVKDEYNRIFEQEVYVPEGYSGKMPNGDEIKPGIKFEDIRSKYKSNPDYQKAKEAYEKGENPKFKYHRFWAQADCAIAYGIYAKLFDDASTDPDDPNDDPNDDPAEDDYTINFVKSNEWANGFSADITITNNSSQPIKNWTLEFDFDGELQNIWNANYKKSGNHYSVTSVSYNNTIQPNNSINIGFNATTNNQPTNFKLTY